MWFWMKFCQRQRNETNPPPDSLQSGRQWSRAWTAGESIERDRITILSGRPCGGKSAIGSSNDLAPSSQDGEPIIGIDLGTTHAVAAVVFGTEVRVIPNQEGQLVTPCVVALTDGSEWLVGEQARRQAITNPARTIHSVKRLLGRDVEDVSALMRSRPFPIREGEKLPFRILAGDEAFAPEQLCALVLRKLQVAAETFLGQSVRRAVITVPAVFHERQRQAILDAARIAGFDIDRELTDPGSGKKIRQRLRLLSEPTAVALAYKLNRGLSRSARIAVLHLGGGTFDLSLVDVGEGVFKVEDSGGDTNLGGDDFDAQLMTYLTQEFCRSHPGIDLQKNPATWQRLRETAEQAKKDLSQAQYAEIRLPFLAVEDGKPWHLECTLTRRDFERTVRPLVKRLEVVIQKALTDTRQNPADINDLILVGGMTRVPCIQELIRDIFGRDASQRIYADEAVAIGAAIQGAQLWLGSRSVLLAVDVPPLSLGLGGQDGKLIRLIERNTSIPVDKKYVLTTAEENQTSVVISVYQGENETANDPSNRFLGQFQLDGIRPAPRGQPRIEVTFALDVNSILDVTAKDQATGNSKTMRMFTTSGLSPAEVERLYREAEQERLIRSRFNTPSCLD